MEDFLDFVEKEGVKISQIKEMQIKRYQIALTEKEYSNHTIARKISALRLYFKHLRKEGVMVHNPMEDIKQPMLEKRENKLTEEEANRLKDMMKENERDLLLFCLIYNEKIKISDVITIKHQDYNQSQGILYLNKRALSIQNETKILIEGKIEKQQSDELFLVNSLKGKALTEPGAYFIIKEYLKKIDRSDLRPIDLIK